MLQIILTIILYLIMVVPVGTYVYHIAAGKHTFADPVFDRVDGVIFKISGVDPASGMNWKRYAAALVGTNAVMILLGYIVLRIQSIPLFNPNGIGGMEESLSFNTIISFMTNTNLQHYSGESGLSYLSQMLVIIFMMFVSAATGYAACIAFIRGLAGKSKDNVGNFFVDLVRIITRVLLPFSIVGGLLLVWQGVPQNFSGNVVVDTIEETKQVIAMGPVAALEIIKHLGTNGGGFLGANSSTPIENPTILSNLIELYSMMLLPGACVITFGKMVRDRKKLKEQPEKTVHNLPDGTKVRKGAAEAIEQYVKVLGGTIPSDLHEQVNKISSLGGTPLTVCENDYILGVIYLKDTVKPGMVERFERLRAIGIKTIMCTGDNPLTAATIAKEAGVDGFIAECKPEDKIDVIKKEQAEGKIVAMTGDGTNDAPALAQANVGLAMNSGTTAAKEAANMVDLDSDPTKILEVVEIGKQLLITRGSLTTFSIANDIAKYFAIIPAMFMVSIPQLKVLNIMNLATPNSAILSALIFNAIIIPCLIPLAMKGVKYRPMSSGRMLARNMLIYGLGGVITPFVGIKIIDTLIAPLLTAIGLGL